MQPLGPSEWILSGKSWSGNLLTKPQKIRAWFQFKISNKRNWGHLHCHSLPKIPGSGAATGGERSPYREGAPFMGPFLSTSRFPPTFTILIPLLWDNLWPDPESGWFISLGHVQLCVSSAQEFYFYPAALLKYLHLFWGESAGFHRLGALKLRFWESDSELTRSSCQEKSPAPGAFVRDQRRKSQRRWKFSPCVTQPQLRARYLQTSTRGCKTWWNAIRNLSSSANAMLHLREHLHFVAVLLNFH